MLNMFFAMECLAIEGALIGADVPKPNGSSAKQLACPRCLTRIYAVNSSNPTMGNLRAGTLDNSDQLVPAVHLWTSRKQPWLQLPENVPSFEKQPDDMMEWLRYLRPATSS